MADDKIKKKLRDGALNEATFRMSRNDLDKHFELMDQRLKGSDSGGPGGRDTDPTSRLSRDAMLERFSRMKGVSNLPRPEQHDGEQTKGIQRSDLAFLREKTNPEQKLSTQNESRPPDPLWIEVLDEGESNMLAQEISSTGIDHQIDLYEGEQIPEESDSLNESGDRVLHYEKLVGMKIARERFEITRLLGLGGMGVVYEARQTTMGRRIALKLIPTHDPTAVKRFEREAKTISQLRHPNTVTVFDYGRGEVGYIFLAMEFLEGVTLGDLIRREGPLAFERVVNITNQICRSLNEAHTAGIVHRDIKPDNIFLINVDSNPDFVKVLDFGIAKAIWGQEDVNLTGVGRTVGTPRYMSPEQIHGKTVDHRSDIYSLGCIVYEMLAGTPPFPQQTKMALLLAHVHEAPPFFADHNITHVPEALESAVRLALAKSIDARPQSVEEFRVMLWKALNLDSTENSQPLRVQKDMFTPEITSSAFESSADLPSLIRLDSQDQVAQVHSLDRITQPSGSFIHHQACETPSEDDGAFAPDKALVDPSSTNVEDEEKNFSADASKNSASTSVEAESKTGTEKSSLGKKGLVATAAFLLLILIGYFILATFWA